MECLLAVGPTSLWKVDPLQRDSAFGFPDPQRRKESKIVSNCACDRSIHQEFVVLVGVIEFAWKKALVSRLAQVVRPLRTHEAPASADFELQPEERVFDKSHKIDFRPLFDFLFDLLDWD